MLRRTAARMTSLIIFSLLTKRGFEGTREEMKAMRAGIQKMIYYFLYCASCDVMENDLAYIGTLGGNIDLLLEAHAPELIYCWLHAEA